MRGPPICSSKGSRTQVELLFSSPSPRARSQPPALARGAAAASDQGPPRTQGLLLQLASRRRHPPPAPMPLSPQSLHPLFMSLLLCFTFCPHLSSVAPCSPKPPVHKAGSSSILCAPAWDTAAPTGTAGWAGRASAGHSGGGWQQSHHWGTAGSLTQTGDFQLASK